MKSLRVILFICLTIGLGFVLGLSSGTVEAETTYPIGTLTLDKQPLTITEAVYRIDGHSAIPMRAFSEAFDIQANWYPETEEITLYRTNNYMRFKLGTAFATYNGYPVTLPFAPTTIDKQIYLPLANVAKAFGFFYTEDENSATLTTRNTTRYYTFEDHYLETRDFPSFKYTLALPYGWDTLAPDVFGIKDEYDDYNLRLGSVLLETVKAQDLFGYRDLLKSELQKQCTTKLKIIGEGNLTKNSIRIEFISYQLNLDTGIRNYETFLVENDGSIYTFDASYAPTEDFNYLSTLYRYIMSTLQFPNKTISRDHEHYVEQSPFVTLGVTLSTPLGSNQEVFKSSPLIGTITHHQKLTAMYAIVSKDNKQLKLSIPISEEGAFNTLLHTPFGSGKHNIEVIGVPSDGSAEQSLLVFSVVNLSDMVTQYLIPTKYIQSDTKEIQALASILVTDKSSSYFRSKALFDWVVETIQPEFGLPKRTLNLTVNPPRHLSEILVKERATPLEYNLVLAGLLRAQNFQAKVVSAIKNNQLSFYVEAYINGRWMAMDPVSAVLAREYPHLTTITADSAPTPINQFTYFHYIPVKAYQKLFDAYSEVE